MITVRQTNKEDIQSLCSFGWFDNKEEGRAEITESVESDDCLVAEIDGKVVGFTSFNYNNFFEGCMIDTLYIRAKYRRQGVGVKLVKHLESICKTEKLFTSTNQSNLATQGLVNKLGFVPSGFIDNIDEGDPEVVYFKRAKQDR